MNVLYKPRLLHANSSFADVIGILGRDEETRISALQFEQASVKMPDGKPVHITPGVYATRPEKSHCRNLVVRAKLLDNEAGRGLK